METRSQLCRRERRDARPEHKHIGTKCIVPSCAVDGFAPSVDGARHSYKELASNVPTDSQSTTNDSLYTVIHNYGNPYEKWNMSVARPHLWLQRGIVKSDIMQFETVLNLSTLNTLTCLLTYLLIS